METSTTTTGIRLCHKLTRDHVWLTSFSRMRVYLAAQVSRYETPCVLSKVISSDYKRLSQESQLKCVCVCHLNMQVMSESVASALQVVDNDNTQETRLFIRMIDKFFDLLNVKGPQMAKLKRKDSIAPYSSPSDERFKVQCIKIYMLLLYIS